MGEAHKGKNNPFYGKKHTKESKRKMSNAHKGKKLTEEHKRKIGIASLNPSEETRMKMREARKGKKLSEESLKKIVATKRKNGKWKSNEERCNKCGSYISLKQEHKCKDNPMLGKKHSEETKKKIGSKSKDRNWAVGERNSSYKDGLFKFRRDLRGLKEYKEWRKNVIKNSKTKYVNGMQVHHSKPFYQIIEDNNIKTIEEARNCDELWDITNGVVLKKGEHFILSQLERMKYHTPGFLFFLRRWLCEREEEK